MTRAAGSGAEPGQKGASPVLFPGQIAWVLDHGTRLIDGAEAQVDGSRPVGPGPQRNSWEVALWDGEAQAVGVVAGEHNGTVHYPVMLPKRQTRLGRLGDDLGTPAAVEESS
ncbi:hypothetical protein NDU88_003602 [Pleurodeles waltl]|uniref:Uncharacterized protein n=1 Tax=Pleurodeles waltl TaxID=8319 RepID=A0AAV7SGF6_PLEWA|nr:hypothetical protein NDU88_003602 [Pleurodeles waltl]